MKILTINTRYLGGGGAAYIANMLHRNINKIEGYSSTFLYGRGEEGDSESIKITPLNLEYLSALSYRMFARECIFNKNIERQIIEADIIHLHNIHGYYINYVKLFKLIKKHNKKVIWTLHDMWPITGRCAYSLGCEKWKSGCGKCSNMSSYPKSILDRSNKEFTLKKNIITSINKDNMIIITPSEWLAKICEESFLNKFSIQNIPNGIEHVKVNLKKNELRKKYNILIDKKVVLFVAADTQDERKGMQYILDIIPRNKNYLFISIGKEMDSISFNNFIQLGYINDRNMINEIYSLADLFVIPSLDDNFPTTVIEAFANSTPVIGFNQGGIPEQLANDSGIIVDIPSAHNLENTIKSVLENENELNKLSINCRLKFENEYTINKFIERYREIYHKLGE